MNMQADPCADSPRGKTRVANGCEHHSTVCQMSLEESAWAALLDDRGGGQCLRRAASGASHP